MKQYEVTVRSVNFYRFTVEAEDISEAALKAEQELDDNFPGLDGDGSTDIEKIEEK